MEPAVTPIETKTANELAVQRTELASARNLMAADRTLMAWVRTSMSMLSFGFTIYKILQGFQGHGVELKDQAPRNIGLFLTAMGTFAMVAGTVEYWISIRELRKVRHVPLARSSFVMALVMSALGLFTFFAITVRVF